MSRASQERAPSSPTRRKTFGLASAGLLVGAVAGWVTGLLRSPKQEPKRGKP